MNNNDLYTYPNEIDFFLGLDSYDKDVKDLLTKHKEQLKDKNETDTIPYTLFYEAYYEKDPDKKLSMINQLSDFFEPEIMQAFNRGTLFIDGDDLNGLLITEEEKSLHVYKSKNAETPFDAKQFNKDMKSSDTFAKVMCLLFACDDMGLFLKRITRPGMLKEEVALAAIEELKDMGYIEKFEVDGLGYFYKTTTRGIQAFSNKDSRAFLDQYGDIDRILSEIDQSYTVEGIHAAKLRLVADNIMESLDDPRYNDAFVMVHGIMKKHFFLFEYVRRDVPYKIAVAGILSKDPKDFDAFLETITANASDKDLFVICGYTKEYAKKLSQWLVSQDRLLFKETQFGYMFYNDASIYSVSTDEPLTFSKEDVEKKLQESASALLKDIQPEDILIENDVDCLTYSESPKAKYNFAAKRFIKDFSGYYQPAMLYAFGRTAAPGFFKACYSDCKDDKIYEDLIASVERIYNFGYFGRYTVKDMDSFYVLTKKGKKAFETRETFNFLNEISYVGEIKNTPKLIEMNDSNQAKKILMMIDAVDKTMAEDENDKYFDYEMNVNPYFYIIIFKSEDGALFHVGYVSDKTDLLTVFKNELLLTIRSYKTIHGLVVSGLNEKQAVNMANLVADRFELPLGKENIYYSVYGDKGMYNLLTGKELKKI